MPIWSVLSRFEGGGLERVQLNIAQTLRERQYDVRLVAGEVIEREDSIADSTVLEIARWGRWYFPIGLWRAVRGDTPEIIFTTSNDVACLMLILRSLAFRSVRVIVTQHSSLSGPLKHARGLTRVKLEVIRVAMRWLIPGADRVVAVSRAVALDMQRELGIEKQQIEVIHNPIVKPDFSARMNASIPWPWHDRDTPTIIFVGRLAPEKRLDLLLAAFQSLQRALSARLLIIGTGPQEGWMREWISANDLTGTCRLMGFVADPLPFIRMAEVLVLSSDFEGFGNVLVEAMACGTQVVATDCPCGPAEILGHGMYGQLVPCGDSGALARAMQLALTAEFKVTPEALRQRAQDFTLARSVDGYQRIIDSLNRS